ncbi:hypothetical protein ICN18_09915 [Polynucleobacter sp. Ross1-W9]|uniref:hypothetical protein n=1 Tax=Polynucleobacter parvulilacunae TaxID=1855631 RepID=UPI001C0E2B9B|nr:hypothetical protein [Polynucleobacter parvulilacunae]MBU3557940.1 hypothetical protein [Polynucleobacter parvulilacunae]
MKIYLARLHLILAYASLLTACSVAKLEARLEANPQCKDVVNPKTGVLMPCPGSDKAFYRDAGLAPVKASTAANSPTSLTPPGSSSSAQGSSSVSTTSAASSAKTVSTPVNCKPQIHKKTGGTLPCPAPD